MLTVHIVAPLIAFKQPLGVSPQLVQLNPATNHSKSRLVLTLFRVHQL